MRLQRERILVGLRGGQAAAGAEGVLSQLDLIVEEPVEPYGADAGARRSFERINHTVSRVWAQTRSGDAFDLSRLDRVDKGSALEWLAPVYALDIDDRTELLAPLPHVLLIDIGTRGACKDLDSLLEKHGLDEDTERSKLLGNYRYCVIRDPLGKSAIELLPLLSREASVRDIRFETMPMLVPTAYIPNDPLYVDQWGVQQIEAGGPGHTGWNHQRGHPDVVICILDEGCDLNHPDLSFSSPGINLGTMLPTGAPTGNHGTACGGIAAARINSNQGVAGVAGQCPILPLAFQTWSDVEVAAGIRYAAHNGARVISMSFGWNPWDHAIIDPAIQEAFDLNVVMCVATHNHNGSITYPATNPLVMACGASDQIDNRKSPTSPDGEYWWGSNYGPAMSVVAPGVLIPTTDRLGGLGYTNGDYVMDFNGTSSATPHVAGLAALLISCDQTLSNVDVRNVIEQTAEKVGVVPYANVGGYPNGTWNQEMGYGRINAHHALEQVCKRRLFELKYILPDKLFRLEHKLHRYKEKERLDELKGRFGYENPLFDPTIYERILTRLDRLEERMEHGQSFIRRAERPSVGQDIARQADRKV